MNTSFFKKLKCMQCGSTKGLLQNDYNMRVFCESCIDFINSQMNEASKAEEYNHGSLLELQTERAQ